MHIKMLKKIQTVRFFLTFVLSFLLLYLYCPTVFAGIDYGPWARVLEGYVDEQGRVDYVALRSSRADLDIFIGEITYADLTGFSLEEGKAFWINAYNALTIEAVLNNYPVPSIRQIWKVWDTPKRVAKSRFTLNNIEHNVLRALRDPRVHFAICKATVSSPKLSQIPYYPDKIDDQLHKATADFINDPKHVRLNRDKKVITVSPIFLWYEKDFLIAAESMIDFIRMYINPSDRQFMQYNKPSLETMKYNWRLNKK